MTNSNRNPYLEEYRRTRQRRASGNTETVAISRPATGRAAAIARHRARRRRKLLLRWGIFLGECLLVICLGAILFMKLFGRTPQVDASQRPEWLAENAEAAREDVPGTFIQGLPAAVYGKHPAWTEDFLTPNEYSRPGDALEEVNSIFVHYTGNPGTSAAQNRSYFEQLKDTGERSASAHFVIGYEGEIVQCVPLDEIAYAVAGRNLDSISIECCYTAEDGSFSRETYDSLIQLLRWLVEAYDLDTEDILRHYDAGGKKCPVYYAENPEEWEQLKEDVKG